MYIKATLPEYLLPNLYNLVLFINGRTNYFPEMDLICLCTYVSTLANCQPLHRVVRRLYIYIYRKYHWTLIQRWPVFLRTEMK